MHEVETGLEEEKGKNLKLQAQLNHDYENSSLTSAQTVRCKKICNSREKTGRKPRLKKTSKTIVKQPVNIRLVIEVTGYHADVYYNPKTGERLHARFPAGVADGVNYGGSIKTFLFLLNNDCCTSIDRSRRFLSDLTDSKLNISKGMVSKLGRESAGKTRAERKKLFADLLLAPVMHRLHDCKNKRKKCVCLRVCMSRRTDTLFRPREKGA